MIPETDITKKVLCVNLKTSCLGTSFVDDFLTETLEVRTGAKKGKAKGSKKILGDGLKPIRQLIRGLRTYVAEVTLPGISPDLRICTPKVLDEIRAEARRVEDKITEEINALSNHVTWGNPKTAEASSMTKWRSLIEQDRIDLEQAFDEKDYPPIENLSSFFSIRLTTCDLPAGDYFRVEGLTDEAIQQLKADHARIMEQVKSAAKNEVSKKIVEMVQRIADNLSKEDISKLRATTFDNLLEYLAKVPDLNITGDPVLEQMRVEALEKLNYTMAQVKASHVLKEQAAEAAKEFLAAFGQGKRRLAVSVSESPVIETENVA